MYLEHFGFHRLPFTIAPDPELLFLAQGHQEALAHLHYALSDHGGLVCLTGEVGTGKTTLCRAFLSQLPAHVRSAYVFNPHLSSSELLHSLCDELGIPVPPGASQRDLYNLLNHELLRGYAAGQRFVCIIDEAQSMPVPLLEQVRLLTNLETDKEKLLTVILVGQPELRQVLARHDLRQLSQRITARYHLQRLGLRQTEAYLRHRCQVAGVGRPLFSAAAVWALWRASGGIPRLLNSMADRALLGAYAKGHTQVGLALVKGARREILPVSSARRVTAYWLAAIFLLLFIWAQPWQYWQLRVLPVTTSVSGSSAEGINASDHPAALLAHALGLPAADDCQDLAALGWGCLWLEWPLARLQRLQVPVLVQVTEFSGPQWRLLTRLQPGERTTGAALVLWQPPAAYQNQLVRPGDRDPLVGWVRTRLGQEWPAEWQMIGPQGQVNRPDPDFYDPLLARSVADFQQRNGLSADRILGPHTLLMLWQKDR